MSSQQVAYQTLVDLSVESRKSARGLPAQLDIKQHWSGIGFELMGERYVVAMGEISEMLEVPAFTRLPGVRPWVRGVSNVRGRLLPLFDMGLYLGGRLSSQRKLHRVLILENESLYSGLIVDRVFGMQHFPVDTFVSDYEQKNDAAAALYSEGAYIHNDQPWMVFNTELLAKDTRFFEVSNR